MKKRLCWLLELVPLLLLGLIPLLWFRDGEMALGHDMGFPLAPIDFFKDRMFTWSNAMGSFGSNRSESLGLLLIHGLEAVLSHLELSLINVQRVTFGFWLALPVVTMYLLLRFLFPNKREYLIRISGSLFYGLNHYLLQGWMIAERTKCSVVAMLPILVLLLARVFVKKKSAFINSFLASVIVSFFVPGTAIPLLGVLMIFLVVVLLFFIIFAKGEKLVKLKRGFVFLVSFSIFYTLFNFYWFYPYVRSFSSYAAVRIGVAGGKAGAVAWSKELSKFSSYLNLIFLKGIPDWYANPNHPYSGSFSNNLILVIIGYVFPFLALFSFISWRKYRKSFRLFSFLFLTTLLVSIPLTAGSHPPLGFIYDMALKYIPLFVMFRTPFYKFAMMLWFSFAGLIAIGFYKFVSIIGARIAGGRQRFLGLIRVVFLGIFIIGLCSYNYPYFTGSFFNWSSQYSTRIKVPEYLFDFKEYIDSNKYFSRLVMLPGLDPNTKEIAYNWKYYSLSTIPSILFRSPVVVNDVWLRGREDTIVMAVYDNFIMEGKTKLLKYLNADEVLYQKDAFYSKSKYYTPHMFDFLVSGSDQLSLDKGFGEWNLYSVSSDALPLISVPKSIVTVFSSAKNFSLATTLDEFDNSSDAFYYSEGVEEIPYVNYGLSIKSYVIEAECVNCQQRKLIDVKTPMPRFLPGSRLYPLLEYYRQWKIGRIDDPEQKVSFILVDLSRDFASLIALSQQNKSLLIADVVGSMVSDIDKVLEEVGKIDLG
jgi:hypothetical protein